MNRLTHSMVFLSATSACALLVHLATAGSWRRVLRRLTHYYTFVEYCIFDYYVCIKLDITILPTNTTSMHMHATIKLHWKALETRQ